MAWVAAVSRTTVRVMPQMKGHHSSADRTMTSKANSSHSVTPRKRSSARKPPARTRSISGRAGTPLRSTRAGMRSS